MVDHDGQQLDDEPSLGQVSAFLLRPDVASFGDALREPLEAHPVSAGSGLVGEFYLSRTVSREPKWLEFARSITGQPILYQPVPRLSGVLFLERGDHRFAITFGYGRHLLRPDATEPDYGLKVAAGLIDPEEIASLDARSVEATAIQIRRQSARGLTPGAIGFNVAREMLRALAGRLADEALGTRITGSDSVGLTAALDSHTLGPRLDALHEAYVASRYQTGGFAHIDRWSPIRGASADRLDDHLLNVIRHRREQLLAGEDPDFGPGPERPPLLEAPEVISWHAAGFRTSPEKDTNPHPFPYLDGYLLATRRPPELRDLRSNHSLELISAETSDVAAKWPLYSALNWEVEFEGNAYFLAEGKWWLIDSDYRQRIDSIVAAIREAELERPDFDPVEDEPDYNRRLATWRHGRALLDRKQARFTYENGTVEPCDVLTAARQFVHVKPGASSAALSHLFAQGSVSARLFLMLPEFREQMRKLLAGSPKIAELVPTGRPEPRDYEVVYAIIRRGTGPLGLDLPFFARNHLAQVVGDVELLGFGVRMARIAERVGARPADAGPLFKATAEGRRAKVEYRGTPRGRRRAARTPEGTDVTVR